MSKFDTVRSALLLSALFIAAPFARAGNVNVPIDSSYKLTFDDEFNGSALDTSKWQFGWFGGPTAIQEFEPDEGEAYDPAQMSVSGGNLHLTLINKPVTVNGHTHEYRSGMINSRGIFQQAYGYFESRIYVPGSKGQMVNWPAFWAVNSSGQYQELDVVEGLGGTASYHFHTDSGAPGAGVVGDFTGWHNYAALWVPGSVKFYYDGNLVGTITENLNPQPLYLILTQATGGCCSGPVVAPSDMMVDYVHVYSNSSSAVAVTPQANYGGPGDNGSGSSLPSPAPAPAPAPSPAPVSVPVPVPAPSALDFTVTSPTTGSSVSGIIEIQGVAGKGWKKIAAINLDSGYRVSSNVVAVNGKYLLYVDMRNFKAGSVHHLAIRASTAPAGQVGGTIKRIYLNLKIGTSK